MSLAAEKNRTPEEMDRLYEKTVRRGTALRKRDRLVVLSALAVVVVALVVPIVTVGSGSSNSKLVRVAAGPYADVSWQKVVYPGLNFAQVAYPKSLGCGSTSSGTPTGYVFPVDVQQVTYVQPSGSDERIALVLVKCQSGTPTPSALYAFITTPETKKPQLMQALLAPPGPGAGTLWYAKSFITSSDTVILPLKGVSGQAAICCPNISTIMRWTWFDGLFVRSGRTLAQAQASAAAARAAAIRAAAAARAAEKGAANPGEITGTVTSCAGGPVPEVTLRHSDGSIVSSPVGKAGSISLAFSFPVPAGHYDLAIGNSPPGVNTRQIDVSPGQVAQVNVNECGAK